MKWKNDGFWSSNIVCEQQGEGTKQPVAKFLTTSWARKMAGKLELGPAVAPYGPDMDEIVVVGVGVAEAARRARNASSAASTASGGGGGA